MPAGGTTLSLTFEGVLNDKMCGFYRSTYTVRLPLPNPPQPFRRPLLSASTCLAPALETERVAEFVSELRSCGCRWVARAR